MHKVQSLPYGWMHPAWHAPFSSWASSAVCKCQLAWCRYTRQAHLMPLSIYEQPTCNGSHSLPLAAVPVFQNLFFCTMCPLCPLPLLQDIEGKYQILGLVCGPW